jgi:hypothetical protein
MLPRVAAAAATACTVVLLLAVAAAAAAATSPAGVYGAAIVAAEAQRSVHYVSTSNLAGNRETIVGDAAVDRGIQRITFTHAGTTGHVTVIVAKAAAYVRGDAFTLRNFMALTSAQVSRYAGRWFAVRSPTLEYAVVAEAVQMRSFVNELTMPGPFTAVPATSIGGRRVTGVRGKLTQSGKTALLTLYVAGGSPLPVAQVIQGSTGKVTTTMTRWNERVSVVAPRGALAFH